MSEQDFITWLLKAKTPSIRYKVLTELLSYSADEARVIEARRAIMTSGPAPTILARQSTSGQWQGEHSFYNPKYVSTHWSLLLLTELGVAAGDERFQQGVHFMLDAVADDLAERLATHTLGFSCLWGNVLRYALYAGQGEEAGLKKHPRLGQIMHYATLDMQAGTCRCVHNGGYACAWGVARTLWGLAAIPPAQRSRPVKAAIKQGVTFLLDSFSLIDANYPTRDTGRVHPLWFKLNFPLFYQVDILFTLRVLAELKMLQQPGAQAALDWLAQSRGPDGRWQGCNPYRARTWRVLGDRAEINRWVSLQAAQILQQAGRLPAFEAVA